MWQYDAMIDVHYYPRINQDGNLPVFPVSKQFDN